MKIWKMGYEKGFVTKEDLKNALMKKEMTIADYEEITGESYIPDMEAIKFLKKKQLKEICKNAIENGFKSSVKDGVTEQGYNLRLEDQTNMTILMEDIKNGATKVPWGNNGQTICEVWTADKFIQLYKESKDYIVNQRFYSDGLEEMVSRATTKEEIEAVEWGIPLPEDIQLSINGVIEGLK